MWASKQKIHNIITGRAGLGLEEHNFSVFILSFNVECIFCVKLGVLLKRGRVKLSVLRTGGGAAEGRGGDWSTVNCF